MEPLIVSIPALAPAHPILQILCRPVSSGTVIEATGEIDFTSVLLMRNRVGTLLDIAGDLTLDLRAVSFIDSSGLSLLMSIHRRSKADGRNLLILLRRGSQPARVLAMGRFDVLLQLACDPDEAQE